MPSPVRRPVPEQGDDLRQGLKGKSQAVAIPEILGFVSSLRKNGVLRINSRDECFLIQLEQGKVVYAQGDNPPQGQLLGEIVGRSGDDFPQGHHRNSILTKADVWPLRYWR